MSAVAPGCRAPARLVLSDAVASAPTPLPAVFRNRRRSNRDICALPGRLYYSVFAHWRQRKTLYGCGGTMRVLDAGGAAHEHVRAGGIAGREGVHERVG